MRDADRIGRVKITVSPGAKLSIQDQKAVGVAREA